MYLPKYFQYTEVLLREKQRNKTINQLKEKLGEKILRLGGKFVFTYRTSTSKYSNASRFPILF